MATLQMTALRLVLVLLALTVVGANVSAAAQDRPCLADIKRLCPSATPGTPAARQCIQNNFQQLSDACKARLGGAGRGGQRNIRQMLAACQDDLKKFCKDVQPGGGRFAACLHGHEAELAGACKAALPPMPAAPAQPTAQPNAK